MKQKFYQSKSGSTLLIVAITIAVLFMGGVAASEIYFSRTAVETQKSPAGTFSQEEDSGELLYDQDGQVREAGDRVAGGQPEVNETEVFVGQKSISVTVNGQDSITISKGEDIVIEWAGKNVKNCERAGSGVATWPAGKVPVVGSFALQNISTIGTSQFSVTCDSGAVKDIVVIKVVKESDEPEITTPLPILPEEEPKEEYEHYTVIEYEGPVSGNDTVVHTSIAAKQFYRTHEDNYDFLFFISAIPTTRERGMGGSVQPYPKGIGAFDRPDETEKYGSAGRLLGTPKITPPLWLENVSLEKMEWAVLHEISHRWLMFFGDSLECEQRPELSLKCMEPKTGFPVSADGAHWGGRVITAVREGGLWYPSPNGGGLPTEKVADGRCGKITQNVGSGYRFNDMELYFMGLIPADEVSPINWYDTGIFDEKRGSAKCTKHELTIEDVINIEGPRKPSYTKARKSFRIRFVLLVAPGQDVLPDYRQKMQHITENFPDLWKRATRENSTMQTTL